MALVIVGVVIVLALGAAAVYLVSYRQLTTSLPSVSESIQVPSDIAAVQHGQHVVGAIALCTECHGSNMAGAVVEDDAYARVVAPNLTRGGVGGQLRNADFARAIRDGLDPTGRQLLLMPANDYHAMSGLDLGSVIAYLKSLPPITTSLPPSEIRPQGRLMLVTGQLALIPSASINRLAPRSPDITPSLSAEYGQYLTGLAGCARCHGPGLSGGKIPGAAPGAVAAANLTPAALGEWSEADFLRAMRMGRRPDNHPIDTSMPWPYYAQMSNLELGAIWQFLGVIPSYPTGSG